MMDKGEIGDKFSTEVTTEENQREPEFLKSDGFTLKILSHDIRVLMGSPGDWSNSGSMGRASLVEQKILLNNSMPGDAMTTTLFHEVVHIIEKAFSFDLSETQIDCIAVGFHSLIKENPEFIKSLLREQNDRD